MKNNEFKNERCILIDESGNLGRSERFFVIACIDTYHYKSIHNLMVRKLLAAKRLFPELGLQHTHEIKASEAYPCVKYHILECLARKDIRISYIVLDKNYANPNLMVDKNIMYNYLSKILLDRIITRDDSGYIHILCDNHTTRITSKDSFSDYIKLHYNYDLGYDVKLDVRFLDSDAGDAYVIQAADYVANAIYTKYEYNKPIYQNLLTDKLYIRECFPYKLFGK